jgi:hypothetical protein
MHRSIGASGSCSLLASVALARLGSASVMSSLKSM